MADLFVHDIEQGIQGTEIKAAFLKCAADEPGVTENIEKVHRAVARASVRTGAPIMAHSRPASQTAHRQIEIFEEEGADLSRVQIAHTGDTDDLDYIERVLDKGVYIGMDRYGQEIFLPIEKRNATVTALLERGYADRMFLSQDYCATLDWYPVEVEEQLLAAGRRQGLEHDPGLRPGDPHPSRGGDDRRPARDDDGREPEALARGLSLLQLPTGRLRGFGARSGSEEVDAYDFLRPMDVKGHERRGMSLTGPAPQCFAKAPSCPRRRRRGPRRSGLRRSSPG